MAMGNFTDFAFGGGMDVKLTKRLSLRRWISSTSTCLGGAIPAFRPTGASVGMSYKNFLRTCQTRRATPSERPSFRA